MSDLVLWKSSREYTWCKKTQWKLLFRIFLCLNPQYWTKSKKQCTNKVCREKYEEAKVFDMHTSWMIRKTAWFTQKKSEACSCPAHYHPPTVTDCHEPCATCGSTTTESCSSSYHHLWVWIGFYFLQDTQLQVKILECDEVRKQTTKKLKYKKIRHHEN